MPALYELVHEPVLVAPVLVYAMEGWIDAGAASAAAAATLLGQVPTEVVARFDGDELIDHRARRPVLRIQDGMNEGLTWPEPQLRSGADQAGNDLLVLMGPEPDMRWHGFCDAVVELAQRFGVRMAVGLGAFPAPAAHTRPVRLASTATEPQLAARVGFIPGRIEVPAGVGAAVERALADVAIPAVGLWARVPHYAAAMPYPAASAALLDGLALVAGLSIDSSELHGAAAVTSERIDALIANSEEHVSMVRQLEAQLDATEGDFDLSNLPSGDEIAAELQRFLRGDGHG